MGAIPRGFESLPLRQLVASDISLATSFFISLQSSSRAHSAAPRFQITTAALGCDLVLGVELRAAGIYTVAMFHVGAKSALLQRLFMPTAEKTSSASACPLAPPLPNRTRFAELRFGLWCRLVVCCIFFGNKRQSKNPAAAWLRDFFFCFQWFAAFLSMLFCNFWERVVCS